MVGYSQITPNAGMREMMSDTDIALNRTTLTCTGFYTPDQSDDIGWTLSSILEPPRVFFRLSKNGCGKGSKKVSGKKTSVSGSETQGEATRGDLLGVLNSIPFHSIPFIVAGRCRDVACSCRMVAYCLFARVYDCNPRGIFCEGIERVLRLFALGFGAW